MLNWKLLVIRYLLIGRRSQVQSSPFRVVFVLLTFTTLNLEPVNVYKTVLGSQQNKQGSVRSTAGTF